VWTETDQDGNELLVAEVADAGRLTDTLAGRRPATACQRSGRGLLHHLADLVRILHGRTTTRTYWRRPGTPDRAGVTPPA
jgi:hypothetical protein